LAAPQHRPAGTRCRDPESFTVWRGEASVHRGADWI